MITKVSTEYLTYDKYGQPLSVEVQLTFENVTAQDRELIKHLQMRVLKKIGPGMSEKKEVVPEEDPLE